ncbi:hypothetical protein K435DRAFT_859240 [Dendrothele bispora CBS 962.96]|uniref:Uncharacterized protein n=1 Tax=Dendrothele bispora (strain CBS 962.96) TaxID=1314807 RepID=A0A4S8M1M0_DENBC|nr:hypothetical protein K435DRAFT_859240 [Dendrothele bispora CBS 962.96]
MTSNQNDPFPLKPDSISLPTNQSGTTRIDSSYPPTDPVSNLLLTETDSESIRTFMPPPKSKSGRRITKNVKAGRVTVRSIKLYTDGALGSWGAALLEPYSDKPDTKGILRSNPDALSKLVKQFHKDGWQVVSSGLCLLNDDFG